MIKWNFNIYKFYYFLEYVIDLRIKFVIVLRFVLFGVLKFIYFVIYVYLRV